MRITRDKKNHKLALSQGEYIEKVLHRFRMQNAKLDSTPLAIHFKLSKDMCPKTWEEKEYMFKMLNYCNFKEYSKCILLMEPFGDVIIPSP